MKALILCGFSRVGKSTLGSALSKELGIPLYDTDGLMEVRMGKERRTLWIELGELEYRRLEEEVVASLIEKELGVVAIGGGTLLSAKNCTILKEIGTLCYLKASKETLISRFQSGGIPPYLANLEEFDFIAESRLKSFEHMRDLELQVDGLSRSDCLQALIKIFGELNGQ